MEAETSATLTRIKAQADAESLVMVNGAVSKGFSLLQASKAASYAALARELNLDNTQLMQYIRIKTVRNHDSNNLVLGVESPVSIRDAPQSPP